MDRTVQIVANKDEWLESEWLTVGDIKNALVMGLENLLKDVEK